MKIKVLVFAHLREIIGADELTLEIVEGSRGEDVLQKLEESYPDVADHTNYLKLSMNGEYMKKEDTVVNGAEIAVFPPVSGG